MHTLTLAIAAPAENAPHSGPHDPTGPRSPSGPSWPHRNPGQEGRRVECGGPNRAQFRVDDPDVAAPAGLLQLREQVALVLVDARVAGAVRAEISAVQTR